VDVNSRRMKDGNKFPNLALCKLKAYHQNKGDIVGYGLKNPDKVYCSIVFKKSINTILDQFGEAEVVYGGSGYDVKIILPEEIEHIMPDYEGIDFSMGRTSWGCPRKCGFCMTWRMEGIKTVEHCQFKEFVHPDHNKVVLFDANFLASPKKISKMNEILDNDWEVCFNQGLDARLVTDKIAKLLIEMKCKDLDFREKMYYFAWDLMENKDKVFKGLKKMIDHGLHPRRMMVYMLVSYNTTLEQDIFRFEKLKELNVDPFVMIYNNTKENNPIQRHLARFCNKRFYRKSQFYEYERLELKEQQMVINAYKKLGLYDG